MRLLAALLLACMSPSTAYSHTNSTKSQCSRCQQDRAAFKAMKKESIKEEILRRLNFDTAPDVNSSIVSSPVVRNLIRKLEAESGSGMMSDQAGGGWSVDMDDYHFRPSSMVIPASQAPQQVQVRDETPLYFKLTDRVIDSRKDLDNAMVNIHLPAAFNPRYPHAKITVWMVTVDKKGGGVGLTKAKEQVVELRAHSGGRVSLHLLRLVKIWLKKSSENLGLVIRANTCTGPDCSKLVSGGELEVAGMDSDQAPYLQLEIRRTAWRARAKRTAPNTCSEEQDPDTTECCMWPLTIDFEEFGWEWVLFPRTYEANICSGSCDLGTPAEHPHGSLTQMVGLHSTAGPCCSPRKMTAINMLYLDQDYNVILGKLPSMKVQRCGCK